MAAINYINESEGDEDEAVGNAIFEILNEYLQLATATTQQQALDHIVAVSSKWPERVQGRLPGATDTDDFYFMALTMAEQTPYDHPSMHKLAALVVAVINDIDAANCEQYTKGSLSPAYWHSVVMGDAAWHSGPLLDVRQTAFDAEVTSRLEEAPAGWHEVRNLRRAFEFRSAGKDLDAEIVCAALYVRHLGDRIYKAAFESATDAERNGGTWWQNAKRALRTMLWKARSIVGCDMTKEEVEESKRDATPWRWAKWKLGFVKASRNRRSDAEVRGLAAQAARIMEELELDGRRRPSMGSYSTDEKEKRWMGCMLCVDGVMKRR